MTDPLKPKKPARRRKPRRRSSDPMEAVKAVQVAVGAAVTAYKCVAPFVKKHFGKKKTKKSPPVEKIE